MVFSVASGSLPRTSSPTSSSTPTSSLRHQCRRPRRGRDKVQKNLRARKRPRRGRDKVQKNLRARRRPRRGRDKVQKNLRARRKPRRGRDKVQKNPRARRRPRRGRDKVQRNLRARRNLISTQFGPSPTQHSIWTKPNAALNSDQAQRTRTEHITGPDASSKKLEKMRPQYHLLSRTILYYSSDLKGRCRVMILRGEVYDI